LKVLKKVETSMLRLKSYRAQCWTSVTQDSKTPGTPGRVSYEMATLTAVKPNRMRYDSWEMTAPDSKASPASWKKNQKTPTYTFVCDGKTFWQQFGSNYRLSNRAQPEYLHTILEPWSGFYDAQDSPYGSANSYRKTNELLEARLEGTDTVDGALCDKVFTHIKTSDGESWMEYHTTWYVGVKDGLVRRKVYRVDFEDGGGHVRDATLRKIVVNAPVASPKTLFAYVPPKGVKKQVPQERKEVPLLANGTAAPDFTATDKDGKTVKLSDYKGKVVILDFWASWCPPCVASMPHNQAVAKKLQGENLPVVLLALDNSEEREPFVKWVNGHKEMDALTFIYADPKATKIGGKLYKVTGIPTQYVIDASGVIRASSVGFGGPTDDLEKSVRKALAAK
jgi:thiol-disulfide isomerase/thioredoxin